MGEFILILNLFRIVSIPLQLLQLVGIMDQNLKNEHVICVAAEIAMEWQTKKYVIKTWYEKL